MNQVIIDTDPGQDDAMALLLMLKSKARVLAVTAVAGNSTIANTTANAQYILNLLNAKVPIYSGAAKPLKRPLIQAVVHGESGLEGIDAIPRVPLSKNAPQKIIELVASQPGKVTILALGPLTNIARAIQLNPQAMRQVRQIVIMGGAFNVPGNKNRVAEFNLFVDPEAAAIVTDFPVSKIFVPLDACNDIQLSLQEFELVKNPRVREALVAMNKPYIKNLKADMNATGALMYDVLAAYFFLEPTSCEVYEANVQIETRGELTRGMSLIDQRPVPDNLPTNSQIVKTIPAERFKQVFFKTLNNK